MNKQRGYVRIPLCYLVARACHRRNSRYYIIVDLQELFELYVQF